MTAEIAEEPMNNSIIVPWDSVRHVHIDDEVTPEFLAKIKEWSYSRIPVLGKTPLDWEDEDDSDSTLWDGRSIYGFFHIKVSMRLFSSLSASAKSGFESSLSETFRQQYRLATKEICQGPSLVPTTSCAK